MMRKGTKKSLLQIVSLMLALLLLAACGTAAPQPAAPAEEPAAEQAATEEPAAEEPAAAEAAATEEPVAEQAATEEAMEAGAPSGEPIRIGGSLALTGPFAATGIIHKIIGDEFVKKINAEGGLLGRPVEWVLFDDESVPDKAAALYERLITEEEVDLLIGPYGTGNITAAMNVAERYGYVFPHHTGSLTYAYTYDKHFPMWYTGLHPNITTSNLLFDALESSGNPPKTVAFVVNQFPGSKFMALGLEGTDDGGAIKIAEDRGYEVVLNVDFPLTINDWGPIAAQVREADPDYIFLSGLGLNANGLIEALQAIDYQPKGFFVLWPAAGPLLALGEASEGVMSVTLFEEHEPFLSNPGADEMIEKFGAAAEEAGLGYTAVETQASVSWATWQVITTAVKETGSLDQDVLADWLHNNTVQTVIGPISFDANNQNYGPDLQKIKQVQDGEWIVVYPEEFAKEGASVTYPTD
ncbi:MAG TPA: amino acid ABC transporter substrate-binding protein [Anaerolineae bacterium]|nr:amino acid ABC transporter substrate-binding protein [Anaerolineae bacterium]